MKDLRLKIYIKNNLILKRMEKIYGLIPIIRLSEYSGVHCVTLHGLLSFKLSPVSKNNAGHNSPSVFEGLYWTKAAVKLADSLKCSPWDIFPEHSWKSRHRNRYDLEVDSSQALSLFANEVQLLSDDSQNPLNELVKKEEFIEQIRDGLRSLTPREQKVLHLRYGLDTDEHTYREIAEIYHISHERVRQIEMKALRKLRNPRR